MNRSRLSQFLKAYSPLVTLVAVAPLVVVILSLTACVKYPVGDPEKSKIDPKLSGVWCCQSSDEKTLMLIHPYDARTYLAKQLSYAEANGAVQPRGQVDLKAWLTVIGGATFLTLEPLDWERWAGVSSEEELYLVYKVDFVDGSLHLRMVNGEMNLVKAAKNSAELEAVIAKNVASDRLLLLADVFHKLDDKARIKAVFDAFSGAGGAGREDKPGAQAKGVD